MCFVETGRGAPYPRPPGEDFEDGRGGIAYAGKIGVNTGMNLDAGIATGAAWFFIFWRLPRLWAQDALDAHVHAEGNRESAARMG